MDRDHHAETAIVLLSRFSTPLTAPLAFLAGGGVATAYFSFDYKGFDPHVALLTVNTFDPFERLLGALPVEREDVGSRSFELAEKRLKSWLEEGPVAAWLDQWSLPWRGHESPDPQMYGSAPVLFLEETRDGYRTPAGVLTRERLGMAWSRLKKDRFRLLRVTDFHPEGLVPGLVDSLRFCHGLFVTGPRPAIPAKNFGLRAYDTWAEALMGKGPQSWVKLFPRGRRFLNGVATAWGGQYGITGLTPHDAYRRLFAQGLRDLSALSGGLWADAAPAFEAAGVVWEAFAEVLLPTGDPIRVNLEAQEAAYRSPSSDSGARLTALREAYRGLLADEERDPLSDAETDAWKRRVAEALPAVKQADEAAFTALGKALERG